MASSSDHKEGPVARTIEEQTAKLPSDLFLWGAGAAITGSLTLRFLDRERDSQFVGQWVPTLLILGLYNKIVKELGHDRTDRN
ncbi:hypothetical protein BH23GEM11_BH23GEM11_11880 [soil metagenome]